jgi:integrase
VQIDLDALAAKRDELLDSIFAKNGTRGEGERARQLEDFDRKRSLVQAKLEYLAREIESGVSFHSLRHTMTSLLKNAGVNSAVVMDVVGHQSTAISTHYTTIDSDAKRRAIERMPDILNATDGGDGKCTRIDA